MTTMFKTYADRVQILKGSSLATLCGLDKASRKHLGGINDLETLNRRARDLSVRLERGSSGVALWLAMKKDRPETWQPVPYWSAESRVLRE